MILLELDIYTLIMLDIYYIWTILEQGVLFTIKGVNDKLVCSRINSKK